MPVLVVVSYFLLLFHSYLKNNRFDIRIVCDCRAGLEEELDMLRVQAAMDRATVKELHLCLANEHQGVNPLFLYIGGVFWGLKNNY